MKAILTHIVFALVEGAGYFALAVAGSDLMYGAELKGLPVSVAVLPGVAVAGAVVAYRLSQGRRNHDLE